MSKTLNKLLLLNIWHNYPAQYRIIRQELDVKNRPIWPDAGSEGVSGESRYNDQRMNWNLL